MMNIWINKLWTSFETNTVENVLLVVHIVNELQLKLVNDKVSYIYVTNI